MDRKKFLEGWENIKFSEKEKKELSLQVREKGSSMCLIGRQTKGEKETVG